MSKKVYSNIPTYGLVFFIVFFLSAIFVSQIVLKAEMVSVPDLSGRTITEARAILEKKDLDLVQNGSEASDLWERGQITRQVPAQGSMIQVTKIVQVYTSSGSQRIAVPSLERMSLEAAVSSLKNAGLLKGTIAQIHTPQFAAGKIISQRPSAGVLIERKAAVGLLVSQGEREERFVMPDLIGKRLDRVTAGLEGMGFKVGDIRFIYYPGLEKGIIIKQSPPNGYRIQERNLITLEVSR